MHPRGAVIGHKSEKIAGFFAEPAVNGSLQFVGAKVQVTGIPDDNYGEERTASSLNPGV